MHGRDKIPKFNPDDLRRALESFPKKGDFTKERLEPLRSSPLTYHPGPVELFEQDWDSGTAKANSFGIGKNYDGYRVTWTAENGFTVYYNQRADDGLLKEFPKPESKLDLKAIKPYFDLMEKERMIAQFKQDVLKAAEEKQEIASFVEQNRQAMGLQ